MTPPASAKTLTDDTPQSSRMIIAAVAVMLLLASLDQTIVSTALPTIVADLGGLDHLSWVVTAYLLTATVTAPLYGKLGDLYGRKVMMQLSVSLFLFGSALSGLSTTMWFLIAARALQGVGGGGLFVLALTVIGDVIPPRERGRIQGIFGGVFGFSSVIGPLAGGFFVDNLSWRWIFYINLPLGIAALVVFGLAFKPRGTRHKHRIDYAGAAFLSVGLSAIVLLTSLGGRTFGWGSPVILALIALSLVCTLTFILVESKASEPILPLALFRVNNFWVMSIVGFAVRAAMFGAIVFLPLYLQVAKGVSPTASGLQMVPLMAGILTGSIGAGQIMTKTGHYKYLPRIGTFILVFGMLWLTQLRPDTPTLTVMAMMAVVGVGIGPTMSVGTTSIQNAVPREMLGVGTAGFTLFRQIGGALGVSLFGALFSDRLATAIGGQMPAGFNSGKLNAHLVAALPPPVKQVVLEAFTTALHPVFLVAAFAAFVAFLFTWMFKEQTLRRRL